MWNVAEEAQAQRPGGSKIVGKEGFDVQIWLDPSFIVSQVFLEALLTLLLSCHQTGFFIFFRFFFLPASGSMSSGSPTAYLLWAILSCLVSLTMT